MLNKVLKKLVADGKGPKNLSGGDSPLQKGRSQGRNNRGFHAKKNSSAGAARRRSIGTRDSKSG